MRPPLLLGLGGAPAPAAVADRARAAAGDVSAAIALARELGADAPPPAEGRTAELWALLATVAAADLTVARVLEPHLDALAILRQAGRAGEPGAVYGVYAAERSGLRLAAAGSADAALLTGVKPWCSLAGRLDRALITAHAEGGRALFEVDLHDRRVTAEGGQWHARGLAAVESGDLRLDAMPARAVGGPGWYLSRPGFAWGGIGVAACWYGAAVAVGAAVLEAASAREPDQIALAATGRVDRVLHGARLALEAAAVALDGGAATGVAGALLAARVRGVVADAVEQVLLVGGHALGPAPLTLDEDHARRVADLTVYVRQHHAERDDARLGADVLAASPTWSAS